MVLSSFIHFGFAMFGGKGLEHAIQKRSAYELRVEGQLPEL